MLLRAVAVSVLLAVFVSPFSSADDVLDYKKIGPAQVVERMAQTLISGSSSERRSVTEEAHELGEKHLLAFGEDEAAVEYFHTAGEALIPLFWTSKSTTRVRSERILAEFINDLAVYATSSKEPQKSSALKLLERYASLMMVAPGNSSSGKLMEEIQQIFEKAKHPFSLTTATEFTAFEGLPNPDPAFGKNEGEKTVAVAKAKEPPPAPAPPPNSKAPVVIAEKMPSTQEATKVVFASGNKPPVRKASARRVSAKARSSPTSAGNAVVRVSASKLSGVTGAIGSGMAATGVVSAKAPRAARGGSTREDLRVSARSAGQTSKSGSPAALRILKEELQSDDEGQLLSAFGLAGQLYEKIKYSASSGVGAERETAENIIVRARMLVSSPMLSVQKAAIPMVAELGDERAVGHLIRLLPEKQSGVGALALSALKKLSGEDYGYSVKGWQKWQASR